MDSDRTGPYERRLTVAEAADVLGISAEAVRGRVRRKTLRVERENGAVFVILDARPNADQPRTTDDQPTDRPGESDALISELRARIEDLRTDRDAWRDQARRSDYMASAAMDRTRELENRLRELEAPREPSGATERPEAPETVEEGQEGAEPRSAAGGTQGDARRPWWRRVFGG